MKKPRAGLGARCARWKAGGLATALLVPLGTPAWAQAPVEPIDDTTPASADPDGAADEAQTPPAPPPPFAEDHRWRSQALSITVRAATALPDGRLVVMDHRGGVHRLEAGRVWRRVLAPLGVLSDAEDSDEEDLLLEAESAVDDLRQDEGFEDEEDSEDASFEDPAGDASGFDAGATGGGVEDAVEAGLTDTLREAIVGRSPARSLWASERVPGLLLIQRADGPWRSLDGGSRWEPVQTLPPARAFLDLPGSDGAILAATDAGLRHSLDDGRTWLRIDDAIGEIPIHAVATDGRAVWAGTPSGLFRSDDGVYWTATQAPEFGDEPVLHVAHDPHWPGGLWAVTSLGVLRSDDHGKTLRLQGRNPLIGTRQLLPQAVAGRLLAVGDDGVWESVDGGVRWVPLAAGLPGADQWTLTQAGDAVFVGGANGVYRLERAGSQSKAATVPTQGRVPPPVDVVLDKSLRRAGIDTNALTVQRNIKAIRYLPRLRLLGELQQDRTLTADRSARSRDLELQRDWKAQVELCFGLCSSTFAAQDGVDIESIESTEVVVVGDQAYQADSVGDYAPAAANVVQRLTTYRREVADRVTDLYFSRIRLAGERQHAGSLPLREQVGLEFDLMEVTARLDVYTDGWFSRTLDDT